MDETRSSRPTDTPDGSAAGGDDDGGGHGPTPSKSSGAGASAKDRKCQYCGQAFTSSSLGRHLDQFLFKKKPDGVHDVEEIRRIRSGITRRQARNSSAKTDTPDRKLSKTGQAGDHGVGDGSSAAGGAGDVAGKARESGGGGAVGGPGGGGGVRMMFNTPTWHATGVINDIPTPSRAQEGTTGSSYLSTTQSRSASQGLPDYASRGASANSADTARALELALREVLDNIKAATATKIRPKLSPFEFDIQAQTFPSLCLQLLPPPPTIFAAHPFPSSGSFPLQPPGAEQVEIVRQALHSKIIQWQNEQLAEDPSVPSHHRPSHGMDANMIARSAQQHEEMTTRHLELAFKHWISLPLEARQDAWQLEITRAFAREVERRKSLEDQCARVQQEANQLRAQVERLGSCQWPREFALFPPDVLPIPREVARELDAKEGLVSPNSPRWDYDNVVAKWKRVVMHDRSMGRVGVGHPKSLNDDYSTDAKPGASDEQPVSTTTTTTTGSANRSRTLPNSILNPEPSPSSHDSRVGPSPTSGATSKASPPHAYHESNGSPRYGPTHVKRARLMNGHLSNAPDGPSRSPSTHAPLGSINTPPTWHSHQETLPVSSLAGPSPVSPQPPGPSV